MGPRTASLLVGLAWTGACGWAAPATTFTGSKACAGCHAEIYRLYRQSPMGRSVTHASNLTALPAPATIRNQRLDRRFDVVRKDGALFQSESQEQENATVFRAEHQLQYAVGSGENGITFLVHRGNFLFQAPLSFYSRLGKWDLSPGYEFADYGFNRPAAAACLACHSGRPRPVSGANGEYLAPPFAEEAIGCENCHGPGALHVAERAHGAAHAPEASIVNPARLPRRLAEDICMGCHQGGDARVLQPGKTLADFRPGTWLSSTLAIFNLRGSDLGENADVLNHHEAMKASRCFRESAGKLSCLTCHNPHRRPAASETVEYYRGRCFTCHSNASCRLPLPVRNSHTPANDCVGCHMPKRDVATISHSALTNHRIAARFDSPAPPERKGVAELEQINVPEGPPPALPRITVLRAYGEAMEKEPRLQAKYLDLLDVLAREQPDDAFVQAALGRKLLREQPSPEAAARALDHLRQAARLNPGAAVVQQDLAEALARTGALPEAVEMLRRVLQIEPYNPVAHKTLALHLINLKRYADAHREMEQYVELFPEDSFMRGLLKQVDEHKKPD